MEIRILGPLEVLRGGEELDLGALKLRSILAQLVLARGRVVSVDRLIDTTWDGSPPPHATATLHSYISTLRRLLEPDREAGARAVVLVTRAPGYALPLDGVTVDAEVFTAAVARVRELLRAGDLEGAHREAGEALALWRGPFLADLADEPFVREAAVPLDELRVAVEEDRVEAAVGLALPTAIADAEQLAAAHPARERPALLVVRALHAAGRTGDALDRYEAHRRLLVDEYGLDPGAALQELHLRILRGEPFDPPALPTPPPATIARDVELAERDGLVGRDRELAVIADFVDAVGAERTRWLVWHGEPGIGKTRLAEVTTAHARARGAVCVWGRCPEDGDAPPHWPFAQILRALGRDPDEVLTDRLTADVDSATRRYFTHERLAAAIRIAATRTLVVVIDDLQWADSATLDGLRYCAAELRDIPVGFVLTVRSGERRPELDRLLATVARQPGALTHEVPPLSAEHLRTLAEHLTGETLDREGADRLATRTGGNAFFATELLRLPAAERARDAGATLPLTIRQVIARRLDALPEDTRTILEIGAAIGMVFDLPVLALAGAITEDRAVELIDPALAAGIVSPDDRLNRCVFAHALVRDAILSGMSASQRARIHARLAAAVQQVPATERVVADRARHLVAALPLIDRGEARVAAEAAAQAAEAQFAYVEAAAWWEMVEQLEPPDDHLPAVLSATGRCFLQAGRITEGRTRIAAAMRASLEIGDAVAAARAAAQLRASGGAWPWVRPGEVPRRLLELIAEVLRRLPEAEMALRAATLITYAIGSHYEPDRERMLRLVDDALVAAHAAGNERLLADVLLGACTAIWSVDDVGRMLELTDELLSLPSTATPPSVEGAARLVRVHAWWTLGRFDDADRELTRMRRLRAEVCSLWLQAQSAWAEIALDVARGAFARARERVPEARRIHAAAGLYEGRTDVGTELLIRALEGTLADLDDRLDETVAGDDGRYELPGLRRVANGDLHGAVAALRASRASPPFAHDRLATGAAQAWLVSELVRSRLDPPQRDEVLRIAEELIDELAPYAGYVAALGTSRIVGPISLWLGLLQEAVLGPGAGKADLDAAVEQARVAGMDPYAKLVPRTETSDAI